VKVEERSWAEASHTEIALESKLVVVDEGWQADEDSRKQRLSNHRE